jgi:hypothetical protein
MNIEAFSCFYYSNETVRQIAEAKLEVSNKLDEEQKNSFLLFTEVS